MDQSRRLYRDAVLALALAAVLSAAWVLRDWQHLLALRLPDTDDMARLQQIRDWLGGQAFADLAQHRLAEGLMMHWSRLPDLVPALIIRLLSPLIGGHDAALVAVIAWPLMLFAAMLLLVARIAGRLAPQAAPTALVLAAIAYPVTSLFAPGRIDHHGFQIVLMLLAVHGGLAATGLASGAVIALASAASLVIGMEIAPFLAILAGWVLIDWLRGGSGKRLTGYGLGLLAMLMAARAIFGGTGWDYPACDGFTAITWRLAMLGGAGALALGMAGYWVRRPVARLALTAALGAPAMAVAWPAARACLHPYGSIDPLVVRLWLQHVGEAQPLFAAPLATAIGYAGLLVAGLAAGVWRWRKAGTPGWALLLALQLASMALALFELRGVYAGAVLGAPALATVIGAARTRGVAALAAAWFAATGMLYPIAAQALVTTPPAPATSGAACPATGTLNAAPPTMVMAAIDRGPAILAGTRHRILAAPYHRNNAGNAAMYRFFLGTPDAAAEIARHWHVGLVLLCPGDFAELNGQVPRASLLAHLRDGRPPAWLMPVAPGLYRITGLPERPRTL